MNNYKSFPADFDYIHVCISVYSSVSSLIYIQSKSYLILNFDLELSNDKNYDVKDKNISWYFKNFQYFDRYIESWIDKIQAKKNPIRILDLWWHWCDLEWLTLTKGWSNSSAAVLLSEGALSKQCPRKSLPSALRVSGMEGLPPMPTLNMICALFSRSYHGLYEKY